MLTILVVAIALIVTLYAGYLVIDRVLLAQEQPDLLLEDATVTQVDSLARQRALLMRELKDIELDRETSKIDDDDYQLMTRRYRNEWLRIDKKLDAVAGVTNRYLDEVERELEERLARELLGEERRPRTDRVVCGECAAANSPTARACLECGASLDAPSHTHTPAAHAA